MNDKKTIFGDINNAILKIEHTEYGIFYFSSIYLAAKWMGWSDEVLWCCLNRGLNEFLSWKFEWIDASNVKEEYINNPWQ